jgi:thiamine monophosphate kinase
VAEVCAELGIPTWRLAACAGEDYELCFCAAPDQRTHVEEAVGAIGDVDVSWIGEVSEGPPGAALSDERGQALGVEGFEHRW